MPFDQKDLNSGKDILAYILIGIFLLVFLWTTFTVGGQQDEVVRKNRIYNNGVEILK